MTMTATKRNQRIKLGTLKQNLAQLKKWQKNRAKFEIELSNEVISKTIEELEKVIRYFERRKMEEFEI